MHEADKPDSVSDLADTHILAGEYGTQVDFASADADSAALGHLDSAVMERVLRDLWVPVLTR